MQHQQSYGNQIPQQQMPQQQMGQQQMGQQQMGQQQMGQQPMGGQPMQQPTQYHTATPLQSLGEGAAPVDCPACHQRALTRTDYVSGNTVMYVLPCHDLAPSKMNLDTQPVLLILFIGGGLRYVASVSVSDVSPL